MSDFLLSFLALCPNFLCFLWHRVWILYLSWKRVRFSFIFSGIVSEFPLFSLAVCLGPFVLRSSWLIPLASLWLCGDKIVGHLNSSLEFISLIHCLHFAFATHSFIHSTQEGHICRPSILFLDTCILSYGCHMHPCFHMTPPWPPFGLDRFLSLVQVHLRSTVVWVCSSFWSSVMANFPSHSHHAIGKELRPPKNFILGRIHWSKSEFGALGLVLIISPSFELGIVHHFFYGLLILQGTFFQNFKFFLN